MNTCAIEIRIRNW